MGIKFIGKPPVIRGANRRYISIAGPDTGSCPAIAAISTRKDSLSSRSNKGAAAVAGRCVTDPGADLSTNTTPATIARSHKNRCGNVQERLGKRNRGEPECDRFGSEPPTNIGTPVSHLLRTRPQRRIGAPRSGSIFGKHGGALARVISRCEIF
jgi:hypothetical protein